ncbi:MAG: hypothetical protein NTX48_10280 [Planctomycetales bacterium]|nr:hypothetical protein [Planctomycetales bacterium]
MRDIGRVKVFWLWQYTVLGNGEWVFVGRYYARLARCFIGSCIVVSNVTLGLAYRKQRKSAEECIYGITAE